MRYSRAPGQSQGFAVLAAGSLDGGYVARREIDSEQDEVAVQAAYVLLSNRTLESECWNSVRTRAQTWIEGPIAARYVDGLTQCANPAVLSELRRMALSPDIAVKTQAVLELERRE